MNSKTYRIINHKIPHTDPKTHFIVAILNAQHSMLTDGKIPETIERLQLLNNDIFLKSEFAKKSSRIIEDCYKKYARILEDGQTLIKPREFFPAMREIDSLLFELSSILDFFAREINITLKLGIPLKKITFNNVVTICRKEHPEKPITKVLIEFFDSDIYRFFRGMRNRITHRLPFLLKGKDNIIFFPDDPESDDVIPQTEQQIDIVKTCKEWLYEILTFVDQTTILVFKKIARIKTVNIETGEKIDL